jgi:hypothetical protein
VGVALLILFVACAAERGLANESAGGADTGSLDGSDTGTPADGVSDLWSLAAELELVEGIPTSGTFTVEIVGETTDAPCPLPDPLPITVGASPHPAIFTWWSAPLLPTDGVGCKALPDSVWIGLGVLDEALEAALPTAGFETLAGASLNGAYLSADDGETVWVFGVAGSASAFASKGEPAGDASEMNGAWSIVPVFDLPLP